MYDLNTIKALNATDDPDKATLQGRSTKSLRNKLAVEATMKRIDAKDKYVDGWVRAKIEKDVRNGLSKLTRNELVAIRLFAGA